MQKKGEEGIRTLGTPFEIHMISNHALSTTQAPLRIMQKECHPLADKSKTCSQRMAQNFKSAYFLSASFLASALGAVLASTFLAAGLASAFATAFLAAGLASAFLGATFLGAAFFSFKRICSLS